MTTRPDIVRFILRAQARMRSAGVTPTWEAYVNEGTSRKQAVNSQDIKQFERLWRIVLGLCPDARDERMLEYALIYMVSLEQPTIKPNHWAFSLDEAEAAHARKVVDSFT